MKKKGRGEKKIKSINGDKIKDGIDTNRDITSNFMTISFKINKMTELLEKNIKLPTDSRKNWKLDWSYSNYKKLGK